jgi:peptide/nickel transport system permease protein
MLRFLARRLCFCAVLVILASSAGLLLTRLAPGDLTTDLGPLAKSSQVTAIRARFALDRPVIDQWRDWAIRAAHFDFGESFLYGRPVAPLVLSAAANTAVLAVTALALATISGLGFGIVTGSGRSGVLRAIIRVVSIAAVSLPPLLTSLALLFVAARTGWFPLGGMSSAGTSWNEWIADLAKHLPLPALALALPVAAAFERIQSSALNVEVRQPFVLAAAARGVPGRDLVLRHAWRPRFSGWQQGHCCLVHSSSNL